MHYSPTCIKQAHNGISKICLLKTGACLIQVLFLLFVSFGNWTLGLLTQAACLLEVATMTGFTVLANISNYWVFSLLVHVLCSCLHICNTRICNMYCIGSEPAIRSPCNYLPRKALLHTQVINALMNFHLFVVGSSTFDSIQSNTVSLSLFSRTTRRFNSSSIVTIGRPVVGVVGTLSPPLVNSSFWNVYNGITVKVFITEVIPLTTCHFAYLHFGQGQYSAKWLLTN